MPDSKAVKKKKKRNINQSSMVVSRRLISAINTDMDEGVYGFERHWDIKRRQIVAGIHKEDISKGHGKMGPADGFADLMQDWADIPADAIDEEELQNELVDRYAQQFQKGGALDTDFPWDYWIGRLDGIFSAPGMEDGNNDRRDYRTGVQYGPKTGSATGGGGRKEGAASTMAAAISDAASAQAEASERASKATADASVQAATSLVAAISGLGSSSGPAARVAITVYPWPKDAQRKGMGVSCPLTSAAQTVQHVVNELMGPGYFNWPGSHVGILTLMQRDVMDSNAWEEFGLNANGLALQQLPADGIFYLRFLTSATEGK